MSITPITSCRRCGQMMPSIAPKCVVCGARRRQNLLSARERTILALGAAILLGLVVASLW
jgi:hypothetical protein